MKTIKIAIVHWLDAREYSGETEFDQIRGGILLWSAGVLVKDEPEFVAIAKDIGNDGYYRDITSIPREYIKQVRIVRISLTPKKPAKNPNGINGKNLTNKNPGPGAEVSLP